jgi:hypothetical protein
MEFEMETLHVTVLFFTALGIIYADHEGFAYMRGRKELLSKQFVAFSHRGIWAGLLLMILTGFFLVLPSWEYRLQDPAFYVKMGLVAVLVVNAHAIGKLSQVASEQSFKSLPPETQKTLFISGALSAIGWVGATLIGFFFL